MLGPHKLLLKLAFLSLITGLVYFSSVNAFAQKELVPGYLGKRLLVGYSANVLPRLPSSPGAKDPGIDEDGNWDHGFGLNFNSSFKVEYLTGRQFGLGLRLDYSRHGHTFKTNYIGPSGDSELVKRYGGMRNWGFGTDLMFYSDHNLPGPLGRFVGLSATYHRVTVQNITNYEDGEYRTFDNIEKPDTWGQFGGLAIGAKVGSRNIIADRIAVSTFFETRLLIPGPFQWDDDLEGKLVNGGNSDESDLLVPVFPRRLMRIMAFNLGLEVHYLINVNQ